jgi:hypothetical protein
MIKVVTHFCFSYLPHTTIDDSVASPTPTSQMTRVNERLTTDMSLQQMQTWSSNDTMREQSHMALHWFYVLSIIQCIYT